jgi:hypothetical protein
VSGHGLPGRLKEYYEGYLLAFAPARRHEAEEDALLGNAAKRITRRLLYTLEFFLFLLCYEKPG